MGLAASRIAISGNYVVRRPKHPKNEVVVPKEEEDKSKQILCYVATLVYANFVLSGA
jgi:hypothetical protein